jgi:hypothetical protein
MTHTTTALEPTALRFTCPRCGAGPGDPCSRHPRGWAFHKPRQYKSSHEHMKLVGPVHNHVHHLVRSYAETHGISEYQAIGAERWLRAVLFSRGAQFLVGEKIVPPAYADVRRIVTDEMIAGAVQSAPSSWSHSGVL